MALLDEQILGDVSFIKDIISDKVGELEELEESNYHLGRDYKWDLHSAVVKLQMGVSYLGKVISDLERNIEEDSEE